MMELTEPKLDEGGNIRVASMNEMTHMNLNRLRRSTALPLSCVNHISRKCSDLQASKCFYENLLGFVQVKRPGAFNFDGYWLFNYGIGIHLLKESKPGSSPTKEIDPNEDHMSFQCEDVNQVEAKLQQHKVKYLRRKIEEDGITVDQLFFHDPDGFMIEVCNCDQLPVVPLARQASITNQELFFSACKRTMSLTSASSESLDTSYATTTSLM